MNRDEKAALVAELAERMKTSTAMMIADYRGLTVSEITDLRGELRELGCRFEVVKNTLTRRAADEAEIAELKELLEGPTAIAFCGEEVAAPAKVLAKHAKESKVLEIRGGLLEGRLIDARTITVLASLPPREVLLAQLLGGLQGPIRGLVTVLAGPMRGLATVLTRIQEQKEAEAA